MILVIYGCPLNTVLFTEHYGKEIEPAHEGLCKSERRLWLLASSHLVSVLPANSKLLDLNAFVWENGFFFHVLYNPLWSSPPCTPSVIIIKPLFFFREKHYKHPLSFKPASRPPVLCNNKLYWSVNLDL